MTNKVNVSLSKAKVTEEDRTKGRMKLTIKLDKDQAEGFKNFREAVKPDHVSDDDFVKQVLMIGMKALHEEITRLILENKEKLEAQKQAALAADGIQVPEPTKEEKDNWDPA